MEIFNMITQLFVPILYRIDVNTVWFDVAIFYWVVCWLITCKARVRIQVARQNEI